MTSQRMLANGYFTFNSITFSYINLVCSSINLRTPRLDDNKYKIQMEVYCYKKQFMAPNELNRYWFTLLHNQIHSRQLQQSKITRKGNYSITTSPNCLRNKENIWSYMKAKQATSIITSNQYAVYNIPTFKARLKIKKEDLILSLRRWSEQVII